MEIERTQWHLTRLHLKPRRSLFTPYKVANGPSFAVRLKANRFTKGVTKSGQTFEFHDNWREAKIAHRMLDGPWKRIALFMVKDQASLLDIQLQRGEAAAGRSKPTALRLADILRE